MTEVPPLGDSDTAAGEAVVLIVDLLIDRARLPEFDNDAANRDSDSDRESRDLDGLVDFIRVPVVVSPVCDSARERVGEDACVVLSDKIDLEVLNDNEVVADGVAALLYEPH